MGVGGQAGPVAEVAVGSAAVGEGDVLGVGICPQGMVERDDLSWTSSRVRREKCCQMKMREDSTGSWRSVAWQPSPPTKMTASWGVGAVPEAADVFQMVAGEPVCFVQDEGARVSGGCFLEEVIELGGVAGRLARQLKRGVQFVAYSASGGAGVEGDAVDVFAGFEFAEAAGDGDGFAEAGTAVEAHHRAGVDGVGEVLPGDEQGGRVVTRQAPGRAVYSSAGSSRQAAGGRRVTRRPTGPGLKTWCAGRALRVSGVAQSAGG